MFRDGYKYWLVYEKGNRKYYRCCKYKKENCGGKIIIVNGKVQEKSAHNHSKDGNMALIEKFRKTLTQRAMTESTDLQQIYFEVSALHVEASMQYPFSKAETTMRKCRKKCKKSTNSSEIHTSTDTVITSKSLLRDNFQQATLDNPENGSKITILFDRRTIESFETISEIHIDSTITFHSLQIHLLIIHGVKNQLSTPILFAIMNSKTETVYRIIFEYVKEQFQHVISPTTILTNTNPAIQNAISICFSDTSIKLFWFHYAQTIIDSINSEDYRKGFILNGLKMLLVLPLLPGNYIYPGFEAVKKWIIEKESYTDFFKNLCVQVEHMINGNGAEKLSIFGLPHCMNNEIQQFNSELKNAIKKDDISLLEILEVIAKIGSKHFNKFNRLPKMTPSKEKAKQLLIINNATAQWIKGSIILRRPLQFLQLCSHAISDSTISALINSKNINSETDNNDNGLSSEPTSMISEFKTTVPSTSDVPEIVASTSNQSTDLSTEPPPLFYYQQKNIRFIRKIVTNTEPPPLIFLKKQNN